MSTTRAMLLWGATGLVLTLGSTFLRASQRDITTINAAPCELLLSLYDEGAHKSVLDGILNILNKLPVTEGEFGLSEANTLVSRLKTCQNIDTANRSSYLMIWNDLKSIYEDRGEDEFGIHKVEQKRALAEQQQKEIAAK
jgi:hypothetical protein